MLVAAIAACGDDGGTAVDGAVNQADGSVVGAGCDATGSPWQMDTLFEGAFPLAATGPDGTAHVLFGTGGDWSHSAFVSGSWSTPTVTMLDGHQPWQFSVGSNDDLHVLARPIINTGVFVHGTRPNDTGTWTYSTEIDDSTRLKRPALSIAPDGTTAMAWTGDSVSFWQPPAGSVEDVDTQMYMDRGTASIGFTDGDAPEVCYTGYGAVYCARRNTANDWTVSTIAPRAPAGNADATIVTRGGRSHLVYRSLDIGSHQLLWADKSTGETTWTEFVPIVEGTHTDSYVFEVHVAADQSVHVVLQRVSMEPEMTYALFHVSRSTAGVWNATTIACGNVAGTQFSSALDNSGRLHALTYVTGAGMTTEVVDFFLDI